MLDPSHYHVANARLMVALNEILAFAAPSPLQVRQARKLSVQMARNSLKIAEFYKQYQNLESERVWYKD